MAPVFTSSSQERFFQGVRQGLIDIGYLGDDLLREEYRFGDWYDWSVPQHTVPLAAFAHSPPSYSTACFSVLVRDKSLGPESLGFLRALGAPFAFEVTEDEVIQWAIGTGPTKTKKVFSGGPARVAAEFEKNAVGWSGLELLRLKNAGLKPGARQLDFFDFGLIPALESRVRTKLDSILKETLNLGIHEYKNEFGENPDASELFRLTFAILAGKILHDRLGAFPNLKSSDVGTVLREVEEYYRPGGPILDYLPTQQAIADGLWGGLASKTSLQKC